MTHESAPTSPDDEAFPEAPDHAHPSSLRDYAGLVARGFCMGCADVVPGVSGGTMAFILGIYEDLIGSIRSVGRSQFFRPLVRLRLIEAFHAVNGPFLLSILAGIALAVLTLAHALEWLLENQPVIIWSFFFGLILASVVVVADRCRTWTPALWLALAVGTAGAFWLVGMVPLQTPDTWWFLFFSGSLAICAMILPGISGAFILVLLGKYAYVLGAVNDRDVVPILWVSAGAVVGIVTFAQVLGWFFRRYHDLTVAVLTGLMLGSLRKVWPWKETTGWMTDRHGFEVPMVQENVFPEVFRTGGINPEVLIAVVLGGIGFGAVILLDRWANRLER